MKKTSTLQTLRWLAVLGILPVSSAVAEETGLEAGMVNPGYEEKPAWFSNSFLDLRDDVSEATGANKRVLLYFYQDGCPYCKKLITENFADREIVEKTQAGFDVIAVNMWGDREVTDLDGTVTSEKPFAKAMKVMFTPTLVFLDEEGKAVLRINGYYPPHKFSVALDYVAGKYEKTMTFPDYLHQTAPVAATGEIHHDPAYIGGDYRLPQAARNTDRPLLVMFEQKQCRACDELHLDILQREDSKSLLKQFDVALLDMWSETPVETPDGRPTTAAKWARELGVQYAPSLVFFDTRGREVFRTEGYLRAFHIQSVMDYVASDAYLREPEFQRYIASRADRLEAQGIHVDLWK